MRPLRYSINVTLDECCDHRVPGKGLFTLPLALAELGLLSKHVDLQPVRRQEFASGAVALRYEPRR